MSEIILATYNFLDALDDSYIIKNITKYKNRLLDNKDILSKINNIKKDNNESLLLGRREIYENRDYRMYMKYYNELFMLVMEINNKYKEYTSTRRHNCKG